MSREVGPGTPGSALTRGELVRRAAGIGAACLVGANARAAVAGPWSSTAANVRRFVSRPDLVPPVVTVLRSAPGTAPGLLFLAPSSGPGQRGAMIVDAGGEPVWFRPSTPKTTMNFRAALFRSRPVLTWWEGKAEHGLGVGEHVIFDQSYREIARFPAGNGLESDLHEFIVTPEGTALVLAYDIPTVDRSSVGKRRGRVIEGVVQELEIPSARVLFEWRSLDHVALTESHARLPPAFDYLHTNSIDVDGDGNLLVSARNTWAVYKIDRRTGAVIWRLGGKRSDFAMGRGRGSPGSTMRATTPERRLTLFDNAALPQVEPQSRGIALRLDMRRLQRDPRQAVPPPAATARPRARERPGAVERQHPRRLGRSPTSPSTPRAARCCSMRGSRGAGRTTGRSASRGTARLPSPAARSRPGRHAGAVCELERRHRAWSPGTCSPGRAPAPSPLRARRRGKASRRAWRSPPGPASPRRSHSGPAAVSSRGRARSRSDPGRPARPSTSPPLCISRDACWVFPSLITSRARSTAAAVARDSARPRAAPGTRSPLPRDDLCPRGAHDEPQGARPRRPVSPPGRYRMSRFTA